MEITQDDLWTLRHLRAAWLGGSAGDESEASLERWPGRAEGRVASWAFARTARGLKRHCRARLAIGSTLTPTRDEKVLLKLARSLAARDRDGAAFVARTLVSPEGVTPLLDAFAPAACAAYGSAARRRRNAANA